MIKQQLTLQHFRERLSHFDALPQLVILGLASGVITGLLMILFRLAVELPLSAWLAHPENFEELTVLERLTWPLIGSAVLIAIYLTWPRIARQVGMANLLQRMAYHQGYIPFSSLIMQFVTASVALISGHSVGREGPAVFLGAAGSSWLGQQLKVPNNSIRLLIGCGTAAAISAAFHTPLAGVIFAMEVILLEYTLIGFTPVIVSAVAADLLMRTTLGYHDAFDVPPFTINSLAELPWVMLLGVTVGVCAAAFSHLMLQTVRLSQTPVWLRFSLAGLITGTVACFYPQIMGVGYDTIGETLAGSLELQLLVGLLLAKLIVTPIILGLGIPAGLIGPTLFIGALIGSIFGQVGTHLADSNVSHIGLYAMLGMGAMMAAVLNAPLAALVALLELTGNPNIIFPGMIAIVISNLTVRYFFNLPSIFLSSLQAQGLDYRQEPLAQALSRAAVGSLMERNFVSTPSSLQASTASQLLSEQPVWILVDENSDTPSFVMPPKELQDYLARKEEKQTIDLLEMPAERFDVTTISFRATLHEALQMMNERQVSLLCVQSNQGDILGMLTRAQIEYYYTHKQTS